MTIGITKAETQVDNTSSLVGAEGHFLQADGSVKLEADLRADSHKIVDLLNPTAPQDAATKDYVDTALASKSALLQYELTGNIRVPNSGTLSLSVGPNPTSSVPILLGRDAILEGATVRVDVVDTVNTYELRVLVNGMVEESMVLSSTLPGTTTSAFTFSASAGAEIEVILVRTAGTGKSAFRRVMAVLQAFDA